MPRNPFLSSIRSCRGRFSFLYKFNKFLKEYIPSLCFKFMIKKSCEIFVLCFIALNFISVQYLSSFVVNIEFVLLQIIWENIIATIKMRNNLGYPLKSVIFLILRLQYWIILYCSQSSWQKLSLLISLLQFLYVFCRLVHGFFSILLPI